MIERHLAVSGTDPTNPRTAGNILARLQQLAADTKAMHTEAHRLWHYSGSVRDVLLEQDVPLMVANARTAPITDECCALMDAVRAAHNAAEAAIAAIEQSKANPRTRFEWHPTHYWENRLR